MACFTIPWVGIYLLPLDCLELAQLNHDNLGTDQPASKLKITMPIHPKEVVFYLY
jgi:hypothetical protein